MSEQQMTFSQSELVFREGDPGDALYVIANGRVQVYHDSPGGPIVLANLGPGDCFGEMALVDNQPRSASAVTLEETTVLRYQPGDIASLIADRPGIGVRIIELLAQRLRSMNDAFRQAISELRRY